MHRLYLMTTIFAAFSLASPILSETQAQTNDKPVVLSLADIQNISGGAHYANNFSKTEVRNKVVSELVQNYDVIVLSRSQSYCLVLEDKMISYSSIENPSNNVLRLPAADIAICVTIEDKTQTGKLEGSLSHINLTCKPYNVVTNTAFVISSGPNISQQIVKQIVDTLHLQPHPNAPRFNNTTNVSLTWVVLPFRGSGLKDSKIQEGIEIALQKSGKIRNLVDRTMLDKVLQELKITAMGGINENIGGKIGKMVGADRILMGWIDGNRVDIQIVDTKTAIIIDARFKICTKDEYMPDIAKDLAMEIVNTGRCPVTIDNISPEQRKAEEDYYLNLSINMHNVYVDTVSRLTFIMNNLETAYLLGYPNSEHAQEIAYQLIDIIDHASPNHGCNSLSPEIGNRAVRILESLLDASADSKWLKDPLEWRIKAYMANNDFKNALNFIEQYQKTSPNAFIEEKIKCLIQLGRAAEADSLNKQKPTLSRLDTFRINIKKYSGKELYEVYKNQFNSPDYPYEDAYWQEIINDYDQFAKLQLQYEKPEDALMLLKKWEVNPYDYWVSSDPDLLKGLLIQQARCLKQLNKKEEAAQRYKDLLAIPEGHTSSWIKEAKAMIKDIESEIGPVKEVWRSGAETIQLPASRCIYLIPVGDVNKDVLHKSAKEINQFFGSRLRILENVEFPSNAPQVSGWVDTFYAEPLLSNILKKAKVPDDALFLAIISRHQITSLTRPNKLDKSDKHYNTTIERTLYGGVYSPCKGNPFILSYTWYGEEYIKLPIKDLKLKIVMGFLYGCLPDSNDYYYFPFSREMCHTYPCICSARYLYDDRRCQLCPNCQEIYKKVDFDKVHADLMDYLKKAGAKIVKPEEVKFTEPIMKSSSIPCWYVIGPFDNPGGAPADVEQAPEKEPFELSKTYPGVTNTTVRWQKCVGDTNKIFFSDFIVDLNDLYGKPTNVAAIAITWIESPKDMDAVLAIGSEDGFVAWVNGKRVGQLLKAARTYASCGDKFPIHLKKGENEIRLKITLTQFGWKFGANILDSKGLPVDVRYRLKDN